MGALIGSCPKHKKTPHLFFLANGVFVVILFPSIDKGSHGFGG